MEQVKVSGSIWGSLYFDHANSPGDQEGFLVGETNRTLTTDISDSQITTSKEEISINIQSFYPCERIGSFYDSKGHVDVVEILSLLKDKYKKIIGWYKFRRNTPSQISMRERAVHRSLLKLLHGVSANTFLLGIFTAQQTWNQSTHSFGYKFSCLNNTKFVALPVEIINLGDTSQSEYKQVSKQATSSCSAFDSVLEKHRSVFTDSRGQSIGLQQMEEMSNTMQTELEKVSQKLEKTEIHVSELQAELEELKKKVAEKNAKKLISKEEPTIPKIPTHPNQQNKNELTDKRDEKIHVKKNIVNHTSPISPTSNFSLDNLKSANKKLSQESSNEDELKDEAEVVADPFAGLLSEMRNTLKTSPNYMKTRQRLRTGSFEANDGPKESANNDSERLSAFIDPPKSNRQSKTSSRNEDDILMEERDSIKETQELSDGNTSSMHHEESYYGSPTF